MLELISKFWKVPSHRVPGYSQETNLSTPCSICGVVVRVGSMRFDVLSLWCCGSSRFDEVRCLCTSSGLFKHIEPHRTYSNHNITEIARCGEVCHMSSGWFDCTEPSLSIIAGETKCAGC